ncbi:unnamed protein product, partial [Ceratitis capitata]
MPLHKYFNNSHYKKGQQHGNSAKMTKKKSSLRVSIKCYTIIFRLNAPPPPHFVQATSAKVQSVQTKTKRTAERDSSDRLS